MPSPLVSGLYSGSKRLSKSRMTRCPLTCLRESAPGISHAMADMRATKALIIKSPGLWLALRNGGRVSKSSFRLP